MTRLIEIKETSINARDRLGNNEQSAPCSFQEASEIREAINGAIDKIITDLEAELTAPLAKPEPEENPIGLETHP